MIAAEEEFYKNHLQNIWINILSNMKIVSNILLILLRISGNFLYLSSM